MSSEIAVTRFIPAEDQFAWTFGGCEPVMRIRPGDVLDLYTEDAFGGRIRSTEDLPSQSIVYPFVNPQTGPFHVEGAQPGDTLAIHLIDVQPARDWAVSTTVPLFGSLTSTKYTPTLQPPLPERTWVYEVDRPAGEVVFRALDSDHAARLPLAPFLGTIGVAPAAFEARNVLVPEAFGGNMDTPEARAGTTIYLGVNVEGALFSIGDGHYTMGDGEVCGVAVEGAMNTVLTVDVIKGQYCEWPRFEDDDWIMVAGSYRPLEDAFRIAHTQLIRWISEETDLSVMDAYQLVTQASRSPIANVCDANYTIVAKMPKRYLPAAIDRMGGTHDRLRQVGAAVRSTRGLAEG
ncbi:MAG TPA: acetamidase/formamidase family protein [Candidatus Limnocylindria bacterium]|nr:acetamidase/formamidase family protein [Candidatus Limnocylindria bacterium]